MRRSELFESVTKDSRRICMEGMCYFAINKLNIWQFSIVCVPDKIPYLEMQNRYILAKTYNQNH
jgi:hypothetical protein